MRRTHAVLALAVIAPVALVAGCGSSSSSSANSTTTSSATAPAATAPAATAPTSTAPASTAASGSTTPAATASTVVVAADPSGALAFVQKSLTAHAGKVTFAFTNASQVPHNLTLAVTSTKHVLGGTKTIAGSTASFTLTLPKGTYHYDCSVPGHEAAGMSGTLTVS